MSAKQRKRRRAPSAKEVERQEAEAKGLLTYTITARLNGVWEWEWIFLPKDATERRIRDTAKRVLTKKVEAADDPEKRKLWAEGGVVLTDPKRKIVWLRPAALA